MGRAMREDAGARPAAGEGSEASEASEASEGSEGSAEAGGSGRRDRGSSGGDGGGGATAASEGTGPRLVTHKLRLARTGIKQRLSVNMTNSVVSNGGFNHTDMDDDDTRPGLGRWGTKSCPPRRP